MNETEILGIYDNDFNLMFENAINMKASIFEGSKLMEHPIEDGSTKTDHKIILPVEIEITLWIPEEHYKDTHAIIKQALHSDSSFQVNTRVGVYSNMMLSEMPHEEAPEQSGAIIITLSLKEAVIVTTQYQALTSRKVKDPKDTSTVNRGEQKPVNSGSVAIGGVRAIIGK
ncbi:phage baseplate protein [Yersinia pekkanenii]|uniref:Dit-like phage tail protein N-terminal domain-containing protein n=1 Tax=Yersinia pekkanenii TaxID=1288385 RepID=A0A0T9R7C4_9GAMM|nr:hypothetical protein [Yersinia pekkanenii]CNI48481.1 Uncharacterised protein [Yersinia pekkanenii]CRY68216.1 Uncharacterised protein [Yersinia pekkanenii]